MSPKCRRWMLTTCCSNFCPPESSKSHKFVPQRKASVRRALTTCCPSSCSPASSNYHQITALVSWTGNIISWLITELHKPLKLHFQYLSISCRPIRGRGPWPPGLFQDKDEAVSRVWTLEFGAYIFERWSVSRLHFFLFPPSTLPTGVMRT